MVINLHRNQIWALGTEVVMKQIGVNKSPDTNTNKASSIIRYLNGDTEGIQTEKSVRSPANTIRDDTKNNSDAKSKLATASNDMEENKRVHVSTMNNEEMIEGKDVETTYEFTRFDDFPYIENPEGLKETVDVNHDELISKQRREGQLITELEIWFNLDDLRICINGIK